MGSKRYYLYSLPLLLLVFPVLMTGETGLLFPLLWLAVLLMTPFFTTPLVAAERSRGTDLLLFTKPGSDRDIARGLFQKGSLALLRFAALPLAGACVFLLLTGEDGGTVLVSLLTLGTGVLLFSGIGLIVSCLSGRIVTAWLITYFLLIPLNFFSPFFPRWTDPLFSGYVPFSALITLPLVIVFALRTTVVILAWHREDPQRKKLTLRLIPFLVCILGCSLLPGGMDLSLSGQVRVNHVTARKIRSLEDPLHIRWYRTSNFSRYGRGMESMEAFLFSLRLKGGRTVHYDRIRMTDEEIIAMGEEKGWILQSVSTGEEAEPVYSVLEIEYHGWTETLPLVYNPLIAEEQLLASLQRLSTQHVAEAGIIIGRSDRTGEEFWSVLKGALGEYYSVVDYTGRVDDILKSQPECLFVLGERDLSAWEVSRIMEYVKEGGSALVTLSSYELDPVRTDRITRGEESPLRRDLSKMGIYPGDSFIVDPAQGLLLYTNDNTLPQFYPLWFSTGSKSVFDYMALWSVPLYYTGEEDLLWAVDSSEDSTLAASLIDLTPESLNEARTGGKASYTTCFALPLEKGILSVLSGDESLSNLMAMADREMSNSAWIQTLAFYLSRNGDLLDLRKKSLGRK